jgi:signal transduction histidine kinase/ligand-binding sensor domain-containing protein/CheY-like chemotaxis protein
MRQRRDYRHFLFGLVLLWLIADLSSSAFAGTPFGELRFDLVNRAKGLSVMSSYTMIQDSQGFMWFGTQNGLVRFDGFHSKSYRSRASDPTSLIGDLVTALYVDPQHRLWVGTSIGLCLYDAQHDQFIRYPISSADGQIPATPYIDNIIGDGSGNLWLGTNYGLIHFFGSEKKSQMLRLHPEVKEYSSANFVTAIERDDLGNLWLGSAAGIYFLPSGSNTLQQFRLDSATHPDPNHNSVTALHIDYKKTLWIGTESGIEVLQTNTPGLERHRYGSVDGHSSGSISDIVEDNHNDLWIATKGDGLLYWNRQTGNFRTYRHDQFEQHSLAVDNINKLYQDQTGTLWIGTPLNGVSKVELNSGDFKQISQSTRAGKDLTDNAIFGLFNAPEGRIWLTTTVGGIYLYDPKTDALSKIDISKSATHKIRFTNSVAADGLEKLWIQTVEGTRHFNVVKREMIDDLPASGAPLPSSVIGIASDRTGNLWVMTMSALYNFNQGEKVWRHYPNPVDRADAARANYLVAFLEDRHNNVWVATLNTIQAFDRTTGKFRQISDYPGSVFGANQSTQAQLFEDSKGNLWAAGSVGIRRIEIVNGQVTSEQDFKTTAVVDGMLEDPAGRLWISTDDGILKFDPITSHMTRVTGSEGESEDDYLLGSALRGADGTFYFGGPHGITAFHPEEMHKSIRPAPPVVITDFQLFNKSIDLNEKSELRNTSATTGSSGPTSRAITLSYLDSNISIEFAALDFKNPNLINYVYKLEGFDRDWVNTDASRRVATYTNLEPGHYVFHVTAGNSDGVWNQTGAQIDITITPPFWQKWWFQTLVVMVLLVAAYTTYRVRLRVVLRRSQILEKLVRNRTIEISQQKSVIEEKNMQLKKINQLQEEQHSELTHFLAVASHDLRQPIHALNIYLGAITESDLPESDRIIFNKMLGCVQTMDEMFMALLDLSLLEAHAVKPRIEYFSIATILSDIENEFTPQAHAVGLTLLVVPCHEWIESDANLVRQILANLTANAVRYTKHGSITVRCEQKESVLRLSVQDTGIGISASQQSIVFEKFHQLDNADREKAKGIGLGLAIVKRLCELLKLPLALSSTPGQGSTFFIDFPHSPNRSRSVPATATSGQTVSPISLNNVLVVVIDDDEIILDAMRALLENWGCAVTTALSGKDAIDMLGASSKAPDILICDYRLHVNENGMDTITMLQNEFNREIPALLVTGDTSSDMIHSLHLGQIQVLHKPLRAELLRDALVRLLYPDAVNLVDSRDNPVSDDKTLPI